MHVVVDASAHLLFPARTGFVQPLCRGVLRQTAVVTECNPVMDATVERERETECNQHQLSAPSTLKCNERPSKACFESCSSFPFSWLRQTPNKCPIDTAVVSCKGGCKGATHWWTGACAARTSSWPSFARTPRVAGSQGCGMSKWLVSACGCLLKRAPDGLSRIYCLSVA